MIKILMTAGKADPVLYLQALEQAGAKGTVCTEHTDFKAYDGLLLCGGGDVLPELYGAQNEGSYGLSRKRDNLDLACIHSFIMEQKPILGICRGIQIINVAFGGSLIQHLPNADRHMGVGEDLWHEIRTDGILKKLLGRSFLVNSAHHQALSRLGRGLTPIAFSHDGCVEAIVHDHLPILGLQFHPERMDRGRSIFQYFIDQCGKDPKAAT